METAANPKDKKSLKLDPVFLPFCPLEVALVAVWVTPKTTHLDTCGAKMAHQRVSAELQHTQQAAVLLFSAGGLRDFTASESPFSYLMSTLTLPQIRARNKGSFNRVGVAWRGKDCLVDNCFCFSFLRARLLRTIFRRSAQGKSTFVCGLRAGWGGGPVSATRNTLGQRACVSVCV